MKFALQRLLNDCTHHMEAKITELGHRLAALVLRTQDVAELHVPVEDGRAPHMQVLQGCGNVQRPPNGLSIAVRLPARVGHLPGHFLAERPILSIDKQCSSGMIIMWNSGSLCRTARTAQPVLHCPCRQMMDLVSQPSLLVKTSLDQTRRKKNAASL
jgi:hypothetical protein